MNYDVYVSMLPFDSRKKYTLYKQFKNNEGIYDAVTYGNLLIKDSKLIPSEKDVYNMECYMYKKAIKIVNLSQKEYPKSLKDIYDPPICLYYYGNIKKLNEGINCGVVGSRNCTSYGTSATAFLCKDMVLNGISIISGLALGIDCASHKAALKYGGYTCAVLGCGIDICYPKENIDVYDEIINRGCILSEFPPKSSPRPFYFPKRNRIISGVSKAIIVIEAGIKSGALNTVDSALSQGKDVGVVPGSILSEYCRGSNLLIRDGATPIFNAEDALKLLDINYETISKTSDFNHEDQLLEKIITDEPIHINDILLKTNIDIKRLYELLFELQFKSRIICLAGNYYVRVNNIN